MKKFLPIFFLLLCVSAFAQTPGTTRFPSDLDTSTTLLEAKNNAQSTLSSSITSSSSSLTLASASAFPSAGVISIESEIIYYTGKSTNTLTGLMRGQESTTAASHTSGRVVRMAITATYHNSLRAAIIAMQGKIGKGSATPSDGLPLVGNSDGSSSYQAIGNSALPSTISGKTISGGTLSGSFSGTPVINCANCTGITGASGGVANLATTTIGADTDSNGSGVVALQTRGLDRLRVENDGSIGATGQFLAQTRIAGGDRFTGILTGKVEGNFRDEEMHGAGILNAAGAFTAVGTEDTINVPGGRLVNNLYLYTKGLIDSNIGIGSHGRQANSILVDLGEDADSGGSVNGINMLSYNSTAAYVPHTNIFQIANGGAGVGNVGTDFKINNLAGSAYHRGGALWLNAPDSNGKVAVVAAPSTPTASVVAGTGSLAAGHYRFKISAVNDVGEGLPSSASTDLTITANQVIEVTWSAVSGARAYIIYAAYNASSDPGTANADYYYQHPQTNTKVLRGLRVKETGAATYTTRLQWHRNSGADAFDNLIQQNPLSEDRSGFYYLRAGRISNNFLRPSYDLFNANANGHWKFQPIELAGSPFHLAYAARGALNEFFKISLNGADMFRVWAGAVSNEAEAYLGSGNQVAQFVLKSAGGASDLALSSGSPSDTPGMSTASGDVKVQGYKFGFSYLFGQHAGGNTWYSSVSNANAASVGVFDLESAGAIGATGLLYRLRNQSNNRFVVYGNGMVQQSGVAFADLGAPANGAIAYCSDCTIANPCASGGTGAFAKRLNGAWVCN